MYFKIMLCEYIVQFILESLFANKSKILYCVSALIYDKDTAHYFPYLQLFLSLL